MLRGEIGIPIEDFYQLITNEKEKQQTIRESMERVQSELSSWEEDADSLSKLMNEIPSWKDLFDEADVPVKRMIINKLIDRIDVWEDELKINVKINAEGILPRKSGGFPTPIPAELYDRLAIAEVVVIPYKRHRKPIKRL